MKIEIPTKIGTPLTEQIETKLRDEIKNGLLTKFDQNSLISIDRRVPYIATGIRCNGTIFNSQGKPIHRFSLMGDDFKMEIALAGNAIVNL